MSARVTAVIDCYDRTLLGWSFTLRCRTRNAFIERMFRTLKEEAVWPHDFDNFDQANDTIRAWMIDYNQERPHASLCERTPAEARAEAAQHKTAA